MRIFLALCLLLLCGGIASTYATTPASNDDQQCIGFFCTNNDAVDLANMNFFTTVPEVTPLRICEVVNFLTFTAMANSVKHATFQEVLPARILPISNFSIISATLNNNAGDSYAIGATGSTKTTEGRWRDHDAARSFSNYFNNNPAKTATMPRLVLRC